MSSSEDELVEQPEESVTNEAVLTKYKTAGTICNNVLRKVLAECKPGASVREVCTLGDDLIFKETDKIYRKEKELKKGMAFPTCCSINYVVANFSPLKSDDDEIIKEGDLVKIELGVHIDGYIATAAHSLVAGTWKDAGGSVSSGIAEAAGSGALSDSNGAVTGDAEDSAAKDTAAGGGDASDKTAASNTTTAQQSNVVKGRAADCIKAAYSALDVAIRLMKPDNKDLQVTKAIQLVAEDFKCKPLQNTLSMRMARNQPESEQRILNNPSDDVKREHKEHTFAANSVYQLNILMSTGDGKSKEAAKRRCTVYRRPEEGTYNLKLRASRQIYSEVEKRFGSMAFSLRALEDERQARLGVVECVNHKVWSRYPVIEEKEGELVAQFKATVLLLPTGVQIIAGLPLTSGGVVLQPKYTLHNNEVKELIAKNSAKKPNKKKKNTAAKKAAAEAVAAAVGGMNVDDNDATNETGGGDDKKQKEHAQNVKVNNNLETPQVVAAAQS